MQRIFVPINQIKDGIATICGGDHLHLARVLRAKPGDKITILDGTGKAFAAVLERIEKSESIACLEGELPVCTEPALHVCIAQALVKGDKFDHILQHGVETGASSFVPICAERSIITIPDAKIQDRISRWQQIAKSAAEQSGRGIVPLVNGPIKLANLIKNRAESDMVLLLHPNPPAVSLRQTISNIPVPARILLCIGPEGGWSDPEVQASLMAGVRIISLGPRILRTETAALIAISQLLYQWES